MAMILNGGPLRVSAPLSWKYPCDDWRLGLKNKVVFFIVNLLAILFFTSLLQIERCFELRPTNLTELWALMTITKHPATPASLFLSIMVFAASTARAHRERIPAVPGLHKESVLPQFKMKVTFCRHSFRDLDAVHLSRMHSFHSCINKKWSKDLMIGKRPAPHASMV